MDAFVIAANSKANELVTFSFRLDACDVKRSLQS
jgi:hypothetical protein